jgi:protein-tyrosine phosphatase
VIDTHCHLLPALDDGPGSEREALELAARLAADGVSFVLCTPHYSHRHPTEHALALGRRDALATALDAAGVRLGVGVAAEISPGFAVSAGADELASRSVGGRFVLVEVQPDTEVGFFAAVEARLARLGLQAIFAHPERSLAVQRRPSLLDAVRKDGALVQVVAPSLTGRWGGPAGVAAWRLVDSGRVDLVASDSHGCSRRRPHLREAAQRIARRLGQNVAALLTERNPALVLEGGHPG